MTEEFTRRCSTGRAQNRAKFLLTSIHFALVDLVSHLASVCFESNHTLGLLVLFQILVLSVNLNKHFDFCDCANKLLRNLSHLPITIASAVKHVCCNQFLFLRYYILLP